MTTKKPHGQLRRGQLLTTYGPGALFDLPRHAAIIGGLDAWPKPSELEEIHELRLTRKVQKCTSVANPRLYAPPAADDMPGAKGFGITVYRFPEWFVVQEQAQPRARLLSRRLVHRRALDARGRFEGLPVVATRFIAACSHGHVSDINWYLFVHGGSSACRRQLWLDELGTSGDLGDLIVRCECGKERRMLEALNREMKPLGQCSGQRPWLGAESNEACGEAARLLIRTASNAYFPQILSVLAIPDRTMLLDTRVQELWDDLSAVDDAGDLKVFKKKPLVAEKLTGFSDEEVLAAIKRKQSGMYLQEKAIKLAELDAILAVAEGYGNDQPVNEDFHARRLPAAAWRHSTLSDPIAAVYQLHRLREVLALIGFTRFEAIMPNIDGEYEDDLKPAPLAREPSWFPAVENRGEGIFIQLDSAAIATWLQRPAVQARLRALQRGHDQWQAKRLSKRTFPGGPYILLHTLAHMLIQALALRCGYPMSAIRERIYADGAEQRYAILLYTGSPDSSGTLGGLVQQARAIEEHLEQALRRAMLCSNDPICAHHAPDDPLEGRWLLGAACHGCALIGESSCEMRNDYLDRALVVPVLGLEDVALFHGV
ncbi:DUF1998 domain-containing protein [Candidatus Viridilinea mediisalina]|uniref:MrfA-like Zn-binding domain-containing protein n=1 Tax=Candidatus Viridilinea mediisalina TaxID=2024553 RepID=A0A2A6RET8_9CHLR|nr:DUF1998 domain-containing protein [Candidatus Viridilinea mediisalina]PDW01327.1 hypothetical protein CJ255_19345 [Candidatus Viridilinea mediisalina]